MQLEGSDYEQALALVSEAAATDGKQPFALETVEQFRVLLRADWCAYYELDWAKRVAPAVATHVVETEPSPSIRAMPAEWRDFNEMKLWLEAPDGASRGFYFVRARNRPNFAEREVAILALVRKHLSAIRDRWERRHRSCLLTAREAEILELVGEGMSNSAIADTLLVSPLTVRRHLENIFGKLGVRSRTAAVSAVRNHRTAS